MEDKNTGANGNFYPDIEVKKKQLAMVDYLILTTLSDSNAIGYSSAMTTSDLQKSVGELKRSALCKHLNYLISLELIVQGGKNNKQNTYFISKEGKFLNDSVE